MSPLRHLLRCTMLANADQCSAMCLGVPAHLLRDIFEAATDLHVIILRAMLLVPGLQRHCIMSYHGGSVRVTRHRCLPIVTRPIPADQHPFPEYAGKSAKRSRLRDQTDRRTADPAFGDYYDVIW